MGMNALEVRRRVMMAQPHEAVASGAVASFRTDVVSALPMEFDLLPIQSGTGDPSPENVRPITGHDGFTRTGTGKNLVDLSVIANQGSNVTEIENGYAFTVTSTQYNTGIVFSPPLTGVYTLSAKCKNGTGKNFRLRLHYSNGTTGESNATGTEEGFVTMTKTSDSTKSIDSIRFNWSSSGTFEVKELQLEQGTVATAYQPFGHSYTTTFPTPPGTVYGGHIRDNGDGTGTLTVDKIGVDMGTLTWTGRKTGDINKLWSATLPEYYKPKYSGVLGWMCDKFTEGNPSSASLITPDTANVGIYSLMSTGTQSNTIYMVIPKADTPDGFLVYEIVEPQTYTLPMTALQSLIGQNHVWVDNADSVSVEYWGH